ncbi:MAG: DUF1467 family protein [Bdellovibrionales bacterium]
MTWFSGAVVFIIVWWVVIFTILPLGVRRNDRSVPGTDAGAPQTPDLGRKFAITTVITVVIWLVIYAVVESDIVSFREIAEGMNP